MPIIKKLNKDTISKIAAGEVVERPASAVKELVENSIDAGAQSISIFIKDGGIKEITVIDDGIGMEKEDLLQCFKPHTTSKIESLVDLEDIDSFGFRGEALSSISSVSNMYIASRLTENLEGYYISMDSGEVTGQGIVGMPEGTRVTIKDLFFNVPARKKYLKSVSEELRAVSSVITKMSIVHQEVSFKFFHNESELLSANKDELLEDRIKSVYTSKFFHELIPLRGSLGNIDIHGYISSPQESRSSKFKQHLYINKRNINDNAISDAVRTAYGPLLDSKKYPQFILFMDVPSNSIDVNIHPQKEKVRFLNKESIHKFIKEEVKSALEAQDLTHSKAGYSSIYDVLDQNEYAKLRDSEVNSDSRVLQVHNLYLIKQAKDGILVVDQHAAHERIIYEKILGTLNGQLDEYESESLEEPYLLELDTEDKLILKENLEVLAKIGLVITKEEEKYKVVSVPRFMHGRNLRKIVQEFTDSLREHGEVNDVDSNTKTALSHVACKLAVKDGQELSTNEISHLLLELEKSDVPYTCPHGRPAKIFIPTEQITKWFKRI